MSTDHSSDVTSKRTGLGAMLSTIRRIVGFGTRRPGYPQSLRVEHWLEERFREIGLGEVRREPVPVNYWEPSLTSLAVTGGAPECPCFPVPYTTCTSTVR